MPKNNPISETVIEPRKAVLSIAGDSINIDFLNGSAFKNSGVLSVANAVLAIGVTNTDYAETYLITANFAQDCTVTFSQNIQHEFDTDNTKDVYKSATNVLIFKAGKYKIGGDYDGTYWGILAKKIAV